MTRLSVNLVKNQKSLDITEVFMSIAEKMGVVRFEQKLKSRYLQREIYVLGN